MNHATDPQAPLSAPGTPGREPLVYLNGRFLAQDQATMAVNDRGTMFGDGVYEVIRYSRGQAFEMDRHLERLRQSLAGIGLEQTKALTGYDLPAISDQLVGQNALTDAKVYWQITRGPAPRDHGLPESPRPTVLVMAQPISPINPATPTPRVRGALIDDTRWSQCWIKSLMLLPNVLAKDQARRIGADEAIFVRDRIVTEGGSTSVFIVKDNSLWTHPTDGSILAGITRALVIELARALDIGVYEQRFTIDDLLNAEEAFLTSTTTNVRALEALHPPTGPAGPTGTPINLSAAGPITTRLNQGLTDRILNRAG